MSTAKTCAFLVFLTAAVSCEKGVNSPTAPLPPATAPAPTLGGVGGYVVSASGACIIGARVQAVDGVRAGETVSQSDCPYGDAYGYWIDDLPIGTTVTIRASAVGFKPQEIQVLPRVQVPQTNFHLEPV